MPALVPLARRHLASLRQHPWLAVVAWPVVACALWLAFDALGGLSRGQDGGLVGGSGW